MKAKMHSIYKFIDKNSALICYNSYLSLNYNKNHIQSIAMALHQY